KQDIGLRPYTSANETLFFRGAAAAIQFSKISFTPFISYRYIDASLDKSNADVPEISSASQTGFHRTITENKNKNSVSQLVFGTTAQYENQKLRIGMAAYHTDFNRA